MARCVLTWRATLSTGSRLLARLSRAREKRGSTYGPFGRNLRPQSSVLVCVGAHGARGGRRVGQGLGVRIVVDRPCETWRDRARARYRSLLAYVCKFKYLCKYISLRLSPGRVSPDPNVELGPPKGTPSDHTDTASATDQANASTSTRDCTYQTPLQLDLASFRRYPSVKRDRRAIARAPLPRFATRRCACCGAAAPRGAAVSSLN
jgi:hypothetical protein